MKKITVWKTKDGHFFELEKQAKKHEAKKFLEKAYNESEFERYGHFNIFYAFLRDNWESIDSCFRYQKKTVLTYLL